MNRYGQVSVGVLYAASGQSFYLEKFSSCLSADQRSYLRNQKGVVFVDCLWHKTLSDNFLISMVDQWELNSRC